MAFVVVFEVAGQIREAMARDAFRYDRLIALDAYPYRPLDRGRPYVAVFAERSDDALAIVALGRVVPGDRSGVSNRNLEFDHCDLLPAPVLVSRDDPLTRPVREAIDKRRALMPSHGEKLLDVIAAAGSLIAAAVGLLREAVAPSVVKGKAGLVLGCERDAVALCLKAANMTATLSSLSAWVGDTKQTSFIAGLEDAADPANFWKYPESDVLPFAQDSALDFGYMQASRGESASGKSLALIDIRPGDGTMPHGVALVYLHCVSGALVVLGYDGYESRLPWWRWDDFDQRYAGEAHPNDPRMIATPGFVKTNGHGPFDAAATDRLLPGEIRAATHMRDWDPERAHSFDSQRHLSNSTFAALLGAGWLGGRAAGFQQVREIADVLLRERLAVVIAVQGHREAATLFEIEATRGGRIW